MKSECQVVTEDFNANDASLKEQLATYWDYDTIGVKGREEDFCKEYLTKVRFNDDRYEVSLPFKKEHPIISDNYSLAQNRLVSLLKGLKSSETKLLNQYDNVIEEQLESDVVEVIDKPEEEVVPGTVITFLTRTYWRKIELPLNCELFMMLVQSLTMNQVWTTVFYLDLY